MQYKSLLRQLNILNRNLSLIKDKMNLQEIYFSQPGDSKNDLILIYHLFIYKILNLI